MPQVIPAICKPDGFYGVYPGELNEGTAYMLGRAYAQLLGAKRVLIGRDTRTATISLGRSFVRGLLEEGCKVEDTGVVNASYLAFVEHQADYDGAVFARQFELSGNTPLVGFELWHRRALPFSEQENAQLLGMVRQSVPDRRVRMGTLGTRDCSALYLEVLTRNRTIGSFTIALDGAHGMVGLSLPAVLGRFAEVRILPIRLEPTLESSVTLADTSADELIKLKGTIRQNHADLGVLFGLDGRGLLVVTAQGELVPADHLAALLAKRQLIKHPGASVVYPSRASWVVPEEVRMAGGAPVTALGDHVSVTGALRTQRAVFAAGAAGRFYFKDMYGVASAEYALLELLEILTDAKKPLAELVSGLKRYAQSGLTRYEVSDPIVFIQQLSALFAAGKQSQADGFSVEYPDWHLNVWPVTDQPAVRVSIEARNSTTLARVRAQVTSLIERTVPAN